MINRFFVLLHILQSEWTGVILHKSCKVRLSRAALVLGCNYWTLCFSFKSRTSEPRVWFCDHQYPLLLFFWGICRVVLFLFNVSVIVSAARTWADVLVIPRGPGLAFFHPTWRPELVVSSTLNKTEPQYELFHGVRNEIAPEKQRFHKKHFKAGYRYLSSQFSVFKPELNSIDRPRSFPPNLHNTREVQKQA